MPKSKKIVEGLEDFRVRTARNSKKSREKKLERSEEELSPLTIENFSPTENQVTFATEFAKTRSLIEAAAKANISYPQAVTWSRHPGMRKYISDQKKALAARLGYTLELAMEEADEAKQFARKFKNAAAFVKSVELKMRLNGLLVDKSEVNIQAPFTIQITGVREQKALPTPKNIGELKEVIEAPKAVLPISGAESIREPEKFSPIEDDEDDAPTQNPEESKTEFKLELSDIL